MADLDALDKAIVDFSKSVDDINKVGELIKTAERVSSNTAEVFSSVRGISDKLNSAATELVDTARNLIEGQEDYKVIITEKILEIKKAISTYISEIIAQNKEQTESIKDQLDKRNKGLELSITTAANDLKKYISDLQIETLKREKRISRAIIMQSVISAIILIISVVILITR